MKLNLKFRQTAVSEFMVTEVTTATPTMSLRECYETMERRKIRHLPVVAINGRVIGVLSDGDIFRRIPRNGHTRISEEDAAVLERHRVSSSATLPSITIGPDASVLRAAAAFVHRKIGCLPVVDPNGMLLGIVTPRDTLRALANALELGESEALDASHNGGAKA